MIDKEKRKAPPERWMHKRWFAYLLGVLFFCSGIAYVLDVPVLLPLTVMRPTALLFSLITLGATAILHWTVDFGVLSQQGWFYLVPSPGEKLLAILMTAAVSLLFVWCVRRLQRFRRVFRWLVILNYASVLLLFISSLTPNQPGEPNRPYHSECLYSLSDMTIIKVKFQQWLTSDGVGLGGGNTYYLSRDGGQTWTIFIVESNSSSPCQEFIDDYSVAGLLNDNMFWIWLDNRLIMTQTGGATWRQALYFSGHCIQINNVEFASEKEGIVTTDDRCGMSPITVTYHTTDGGHTWAAVP